jgi:hypothetical protein
MNAQVARNDIVGYSSLGEVPDENPHEGDAGRIPDHLRQRITFDLTRTVVGEDAFKQEDINEQNKRMYGNGDEKAIAILEKLLYVGLYGLYEEHMFPP